jgi:Restriction endonuclease BglII
MRIVETYSHLNGLEFLLVHKKSLWKEIQDVIKRADASICRTKISKEVRTRDQMFFSPRAMNNEIRSRFRNHKWSEQRISYWVTSDAKLIRKTLFMGADQQKAEIEGAGLKPLRSYNQTDFVKERVAVEVQFGKYAFVAYDLFVKHLAFYVGDVIDVGVEILPMKELQQQMSSGVGYYEGELYNLIREGRGVPSVPLIVIGVAP